MPAEVGWVPPGEFGLPVPLTVTTANAGQLDFALQNLVRKDAVAEHTERVETGQGATKAGGLPVGSSKGTEVESNVKSSGDAESSAQGLI